MTLLKKFLEQEAKAIISVDTKLKDLEIEKALELLNQCIDNSAKLVISGVGKSANIAQKIVATFNSTGQPAIFMHASDALHGDLGNIQKNDIIIIISKSGESKEIKSLLPFIKNMNNTIMCITGNINSYLVKNSDFSLFW